jgi:predicted permease
MKILRRLLGRARAGFRKGDLEARMDEEMRFHLDMQTRENIEVGMSSAEARRAAIRSFGGVEQVKETCRDQRRVVWLEDVFQDLRYGARMLRRSRGFTAVTVLTLGLGIGACVAIFSVVDAVLLRPLLFPGSDRLVVFQETNLPRWSAGSIKVAPGKYFDWQKQAQSFEGLAAKQEVSFNLTGLGEPVRVSAARITANMLSMLRVRPVLGRDFDGDEDAPGKEKVVILSHGFWARQFGGRQEAIGQTIRLDDRPFTVVGVMPPGFELDGPRDLFTPAAFGPEAREDRDRHTTDVFGRLKRGVTLAQAQGEMAAVAARIAKQYPARDGVWGVQVTPMLEARVGEVRRLLLSLLGAVAFLLLIACANVANLLLARATGRTREIAVRAALGARRGRVVRQLLTESMLITVFGGLLGLVFAGGGMRALLALAPDILPRSREIAVDWRALALACALALTTGVVFGVAPAFGATRLKLDEALREGGRGTGETPRRQRLRGALVVSEVAIAIVLLIGAGLLMRSFARLQAVQPGFEPHGALSFAVTLSQEKYGSEEKQRAFIDDALGRLSALPGVEAAAATWSLPFTSARGPMIFLDVADRPSTGARYVTSYYPITPDYFRAMGIPLRRGRYFDRRDTADAPRVAVINEAAARRYFPGQDPIGKRIRVDVTSQAWWEIVGIVGDVKHGKLDAEVPAQTYEPMAQRPRLGGLTFVVRGAGPSPTALTAAMRAAIQSVDRDQPIANVRTLDSWIAESIARQRFAMTLFTVFSGMALLLAAIGIYGVMAYSVSQRTGEIAIRMALGAHTGNILRGVFAQGGRLIALGALAGVIGALLLTRFLEKMLFNVSTHDPVTFGAIVVLLAAVAIVACLLPARRASKINPMLALRAE